MPNIYMTCYLSCFLRLAEEKILASIIVVVSVMLGIYCLSAYDKRNASGRSLSSDSHSHCNYPPSLPHAGRLSHWNNVTPNASRSSIWRLNDRESDWRHDWNLEDRDRTWGGYRNWGGARRAGFWQGVEFDGSVGVADVSICGRRASSAPPSSTSATSRANRPTTLPHAAPPQDPQAAAGNEENDSATRRGNANDRNSSSIAINSNSSSTTRRRKADGPAPLEHLPRRCGKAKALRRRAFGEWLLTEILELKLHN